jgi:hypothetical protein
MSTTRQPALCIGCGCDEHHACNHGGTGCWWMRFDAAANVGVCSQCEDLVKAFDQGQREPFLTLIAERYYRQVMFLYEETASALAWLRAPQPVLKNCIPRELILAGRLDELRAVLDQIRDGVYS